MIAFLPEVTSSIQHSVKTHGGVPVQPVHDFGQVFRVFRFDEIVNMVTHHTERVEFESVLFDRFFDSVE